VGAAGNDVAQPVWLSARRKIPIDFKPFGMV